MMQKIVYALDNILDFTFDTTYHPNITSIQRMMKAQQLKNTLDVFTLGSGLLPRLFYTLCTATKRTLIIKLISLQVFTTDNIQSLKIISF